MFCRTLLGYAIVQLPEFLLFVYEYVKKCLSSRKSIQSNDSPNHEHVAEGNTKENRLRMVLEQKDNRPEIATMRVLNKRMDKLECEVAKKSTLDQDMVYKSLKEMESKIDLLAKSINP